MKKYIFYLLFLFLAQAGAGQDFKYILLSDTHIGGSTAEEDLKRSIADINKLADIDFVIITGDITEMGTKTEIKLAKELFSALKVPYYILPGNHDTGWSESGGVDFIREFGYDKFTFDHKGYRFIGCASGPYVRMSDGHIPRDAMIWLDSLIKATPAEMPIVFANHYPLDNGLDNWYEAIDLLKTRNIKYAICGHGHNNKALDFEGIPATMGRSNLRASDPTGGYNIVSMTADAVYFATKKPDLPEGPVWRKIALNIHNKYIQRPPRPDFDLNLQHPQVSSVWTYHSAANVVSTPVAKRNRVVFGNSLGMVEALSTRTGKKIWSYKTAGAIYSSPVVVDKVVVMGSGDGHIYALDLQSGRLRWKFAANSAVLGSAVEANGIVYIGASDGEFRAIQAHTGKLIWTFNEVEGTVAGTPLLYNGMVIFGSWGRHLYALDQHTGALKWKWNNGSQNRMFSPAMCTPVANNGVVYIAAPDRVLTAIDATTGQQFWRNKDASVRESIGISEDGQTIFGKTMNDEIVGFAADRENKGVQWRLNLKYGYEHVPSMLIAKDDLVFFGTKNGVVYAFDPKQKQPSWAFKIDNSMVNTVNVINRNRIIAATMDGVVTLLGVRPLR